MKILGISGSLTFNNDDTSAALLIDGKLINNYEEERFNRIKHSVGKNFPYLSVQKILKENNLKLDDIDAIGIPHDTHHSEKMLDTLIKKLDPSCKKRPKLFYKDHHTNHAFDSFFQSGFNSAVAVIIDGSGDNRDGISIFHFKDGKINDIRRWSVLKSLGVLYSSGTMYAGLGNFGDGKFMGLAPYGKPTEPLFYKWENNDIISSINFSYDSDDINLRLTNNTNKYARAVDGWLEKNCFPYYTSTKDNKDIMYYQNVAASVQKCFNDIMFNVCKYAKEQTGEDNLILSGGCIQNCIGNNLIVESGLFKNVFAGPAPHDAGCAAGLAFYTAYMLGEKIENKRLTNSYVGITYSDEEILSAIDTKKYNISEYNPKALIKMMNGQQIGAWYQGGSEIGPRALGHRSIIGNPKFRNNLNIINNTIKHRENWRPLAPSIPQELFYEVFDTNSEDLTEFMLRTIVIKPEWRKKMIAVCHVDNTTRPQTVRKEDNPEFHELLMLNYQYTGIPCLINTSFNGKGEPIIETPKEAMNFMDKTPNMNFIVFNAKYLVTRKEDDDD